MESWGYKSLQNDTALDWICEIEDEGFDVIKRLLDDIEEEENWDIIHEYKNSILIVLIADLICYLKGCGDVDTTNWINHPNSEIALKSKLKDEKDKFLDSEFVMKIFEMLSQITSNENELYKYWRKTPDYENWSTNIQQLSHNLSVL